MATDAIHPTSTAASLRATAKVAAILLVSAVAMPVQALVLALTRGRAAFALPRAWHRVLCRVLGIEADIVGVARTQGRTVFVGNHVSHFDIVLLGSVLRARFLAKDDMQRWPGMRFVGGLQQTVFISRRARDAKGVAAEVAGVMRRGHDLVLFAEGTTSCGRAVLPFKSSLFSLLLDEDGGRQPSAWTLQPFTLDIRAVDGRMLDAGGDRDGYAFHGAMDAGAHVRRFLRLSGARVRLVFHAPIALAPGMDRKALAAQAHAVVSSGLSSADPAFTGDSRRA